MLCLCLYNLNLPLEEPYQSPSRFQPYCKGCALQQVFCFCLSSKHLSQLSKMLSTRQLLFGIYIYIRLYILITWGVIFFFKKSFHFRISGKKTYPG